MCRATFYFSRYFFFFCGLIGAPNSQAVFELPPYQENPATAHFIVMIEPVITAKPNRDERAELAPPLPARYGTLERLPSSGAGSDKSLYINPEEEQRKRENTRMTGAGVPSGMIESEQRQSSRVITCLYCFAPFISILILLTLAISYWVA